MGEYQPRAAGVGFIARGAFFYTANGLGLAEWDAPWRGSWREIEDAGRRWCAAAAAAAAPRQPARPPARSYQKQQRPPFRAAAR